MLVLLCLFSTAMLHSLQLHHTATYTMRSERKATASIAWSGLTPGRLLVNTAEGLWQSKNARCWCDESGAMWRFKFLWKVPAQMFSGLALLA